tara:strand:- start:956 stop:1516 length:561 start_codon:yes stop_codon:yes gene_type:complete
MVLLNMVDVLSLIHEGFAHQNSSNNNPEKNVMSNNKLTPEQQAQITLLTAAMNDSVIGKKINTLATKDDINGIDKKLDTLLNAKDENLDSGNGKKASSFTIDNQSLADLFDSHKKSKQAYDDMVAKENKRFAWNNRSKGFAMGVGSAIVLTTVVSKVKARRAAKAAATTEAPDLHLAGQGVNYASA